MDYDQAVTALDSVIGSYVIVYPAGEDPQYVGQGLSAWGTLKRDDGVTGAAAGRRYLSETGAYARFNPNST